MNGHSIIHAVVGSIGKRGQSMADLVASTFLTAAAWLLLFCAHPAVAQMPDIYRLSDNTSHSDVQYRRFDIAKGKAVELANLQGPGKITYFSITDDGLPKFYPGLVLKIFWDDAREPSINVPLAEFFGAFETKTIDYQSRLLSINHHYYMSYLPMPFSKRARFVLANDGSEDYSRVIAYGIDYEKGRAFANEKSRHIVVSIRREEWVQKNLKAVERGPLTESEQTLLKEWLA